MDVQVDDLRLRIEREVPHELLELDARQHAPAVAHQTREQVELLGGEFDRVVVDGTRRARGSSLTSPTAITAPSVRGARRASASIRATSSAKANGLTR